MVLADGLSRMGFQDAAFEVSLIFDTQRLGICTPWQVSKTFLNFLQIVIKFYNMFSVGVDEAYVSAKAMTT
jgi:hypothetical protein